MRCEEASAFPAKTKHIQGIQLFVLMLVAFRALPSTRKFAQMFSNSAQTNGLETKDTRQYLCAFPVSFSSVRILARKVSYELLWLTSSKPSRASIVSRVSCRRPLRESRAFEVNGRYFNGQVFVGRCAFPVFIY